MISGYYISSETAKMDLDVIHGFLSRSYWARGIPRQTVERSMRHSLCFGVFTDNHQQIGFARMITDRATFAYLGDVFVLEPHRGQGLSKWLMGEVLKHPQLQGLRRMMLATADAHGLYKPLGFEPLAEPHKYMTIHRPGIYQHGD